MSVLLPSKPIALDTNNSNNAGNTGNSNNLVIDDTGIFLLDDNGPNTSIILKINNGTALIADNNKHIGINTTNPLQSRLEINDPLGDCIKLIYNNDKYAYLRVSENGNLGLEPFPSQYVNIKSTTGNLGIKVNDEIIYSSVNELNYNHISEIGVAEQNKTVVLDSDKSYYGINNLSVDNLIINKSLTMDMDSDKYSLVVKNSTGKCLKLVNDTLFSTITLKDDGILNFCNDSGPIEIMTNSLDSINYPLQLTTDNNIINSGVGIKFNTYNNINIKRNMSSIESIITNNENNKENSIIKINNMNNGVLLNTVTIRNDGYILCNTLMELSDSRKKEIQNKSNYNESLKKINQIKTYDFVYKDDDKKIIHKGVMAQELSEVIPSAVNIGEEYTISNKEIIGYLIDAVKSLSDSITEIKYKVKQLELK